MPHETPETIRLFGLEAGSIVDGPGFRAAIFTQGCTHHCEGCHNPESHDPKGGTLWSLDDVEKKFTDNPLLSGITLSGGEPFLQAEPCAELARRAHAKGLTVWVFSGYTYEELEALSAQHPAMARLLSETDVLVDGRFVLARRSLELDYRGSANQRLVDVPKTRATGALTLYTPPEW